MALKLLNPGLRPLGMFDLDDTDATNLVGGEYVELQTDDNTVEAYAADAGQLVDGAGSIVSFARGSRNAGRLGGLADEGVAGYGTLFGEMIGSTAGQATSQSGAVVIGPQTNAGSGKVTVFATAGLYGVTQGVDGELESAAANAQLCANGTTGLLGTTEAQHDVALFVGAMSDTSLVSTTNAAAGLASATEYFAVFYLGNAASPDTTA